MLSMATQRYRRKKEELMTLRNIFKKQKERDNIEEELLC